MKQLRDAVSKPDPNDLRENALRGLREFERTARAANVEIDELRVAHYALVQASMKSC